MVGLDMIDMRASNIDKVFRNKKVSTLVRSGLAIRGFKTETFSMEYWANCLHYLLDGRMCWEVFTSLSNEPTFLPSPIIEQRRQRLGGGAQ